VLLVVVMASSFEAGGVSGRHTSWTIRPPMDR
jgi:hypothetical protein